MKREQVIQMAQALGVWSEPITADKMTVIVNHVINVVTEQTFAEAERVCDDVEEPAWYGYECPNTFQDGRIACAAALRREAIERAALARAVEQATAARLGVKMGDV